MTVGIGFDIHRTVEGRRLMLGGVEIDHPMGLQGHSDGDVLIHALIDALLGAAGAGDIGQRFPSSDLKWKGIASEVMLNKVMDDIRDKWEIVNADLMILTEEPKIGPVRDQIIAKLAELMGIDASRINVKGKTLEGLGPIGKGSAMAAQAVVELNPR